MSIKKLNFGPNKKTSLPKTPEETIQELLENLGLSQETIPELVQRLLADFMASNKTPEKTITKLLEGLPFKPKKGEFSKTDFLSLFEKSTELVPTAHKKDTKVSAIQTALKNQIPPTNQLPSSQITPQNTIPETKF